MLINHLVVGPLSTNCYLLSCPESKYAIIVDPGGDPDLIEAAVEQNGLVPSEIVCTHGHSDHIAVAADLMKKYGIGLAIHSADTQIVKMSVNEAPLWGLGTIEEPSVSRELSHGNRIIFGNVHGKVLHTPGHTPGGISLLFKDIVFVGDTLFAGSIGRTDFPGGNFDTLITSIRSELMVLPDETKVYCGHGPSTTIGEERRENPFINSTY